MQSEAHWDGGVPAALKDHALVPVSGGLLASAQHCADRVLLRNCDLRHSPGGGAAELLACLVALRCLVTDDPRCDRVRVLTATASANPAGSGVEGPRAGGSAGAAGGRAAQRFSNLDERRKTGADSQAAGDAQQAGQTAAHFRTIRTVAADAVAALHDDSSSATAPGEAAAVPARRRRLFSGRACLAGAERALGAPAAAVRRAAAEAPAGIC